MSSDLTTCLTVSYVANHGYDLQETVNANMYASAASTKHYGGIYGGLPTAPPDAAFRDRDPVLQQRRQQLRRPHAALPAHLQLRATSQVHYTWSHALGTVAYENPFNLSNSYGSLGFDNRHQVAGDLLWSQPFKASNKAVNGLIAGWTLASKMYIYSGAPFSVTDSKIPTQVNSAGGILTPLADLLTPSAFSATAEGNAVGHALPAEDRLRHVPPARASSPRSRPIGAISRPTVPRPGLLRYRHEVAAQLRGSKRSMTFTLGMQAYNVLNHPNFANPSGTLSSDAFGADHQHSGTAHQHLRYGPGRSGFGTPDGCYRNVYVLGTRTVSEMEKGRAFGPALFFWYAGHVRKLGSESPRYNPAEGLKEAQPTRTAGSSSHRRQDGEDRIVPGKPSI